MDKQQDDERMKLTAAQVRAIRRRYDRRSERRITQRELAALYGVDASTISQIVLGRSRKNLGGPRVTTSHDVATRATGEFNGGAKLSEQQVRTIRKLYAEQSPRVTQRALAERYGVSNVAIHFIVNGKSWKYVV